MPTSTLHHHVLAYLKCIFGLQVVFLANPYNQSISHQTEPESLLAGTLILDQLEAEEDPTDVNFNTTLLFISLLLLLTSAWDSVGGKASCKCKQRDDESMLVILGHGLVQAKHQHYLAPQFKRISQQENKHACFDDWFMESDHTWAVVARISKSDFTSLLREIADNPVFQNRSFQDQASVAWQLLVAMANFSLSGNGGQSAIIAKLFPMAGCHWTFGLPEDWDQHLELPPTVEEENLAAIGNSRLSEQRRESLYEEFLQGYI
ncbi:hypothetical protein CROQUDRAFT_98493 [Cronartium quercuum f. sp. fusiforme G11]|uniref:Uncharacterized protein n=1 Tax=Cronartium quercuum f. sp. fusiforme G11 TaxID=708437 RepID=A0A9P6T7L2_9BASI|nr:hypothetical protein CROQUDRAFT_98493 [Cronartium quercuum f. sp. fusiforme G11]